MNFLNANLDFCSVFFNCIFCPNFTSVSVKYFYRRFFGETHYHSLLPKNYIYYQKFKFFYSNFSLCMFVINPGLYSELELFSSEIWRIYR